MKRAWFVLSLLVAAAVSSGAQAAAVSGLYFGETGCGHCDVFLFSEKAKIEKKHDILIDLTTYDILKTEEYALCVQKLAEKGLSFRVFPVLFIGDNVYQGNSEIDANLEAELDYFKKNGKYRPKVERPTIESPNGPAVAAQSGFSARAVPVFLAGLLDGVNPCAFSTLLFFLSFLALRKKSKRTTAAVGAAFIASVFTAYFLMGLGFLQGLRALAEYRALGIVLNVAVSAASLVLGALNVRDALRARNGNPEDSVLKLPAPLVKANHFAIRTFASGPAVVVGAALSGALVSVLELACTGQIYFPTLAYINRTAPTAGSVFLLALYNGAFVLPLLAVFAFFLFGGFSARFGKRYRDRIALVRALTAAFFFCLAALIWIV